MNFKQSPNFVVGTVPKIGFIIHGTIGSYESAVNWLCESPEERLRKYGEKTYSSAHYVVAKDGRYTKLVEEKDEAWHAGTISNPTEYAAKVLPKTIFNTYKNPNQSFIGIELEWFPNDVVTSQQYDVVCDIIKRSGIVDPIILCHKEVASFKSDFQKADKSLDLSIVEEVRKRIKAFYAPQPVKPKTLSTEEKKAQIIKLIQEL